MPINWNVNHSNRHVDATVEGTLTADDVAAFIEHLAQERAMPYSKLFDATSADDLLSPADVKVLGRRLREIIMTGQGPLGPLAVVVSKNEDYLRAGQYADASGALRPVKVFRERDAAQRWLRPS